MTTSRRGALSPIVIRQEDEKHGMGRIRLARIIRLYAGEGHAGAARLCTVHFDDSPVDSMHKLLGNVQLTTQIIPSHLFLFFNYAIRVIPMSPQKFALHSLSIPFLDLRATRT